MAAGRHAPFNFNSNSMDFTIHSEYYGCLLHRAQKTKFGICYSWFQESILIVRNLFVLEQSLKRMRHLACRHQSRAVNSVRCVDIAQIPIVTHSQPRAPFPHMD